MNHGSIFSGLGGFDLAAEIVGWTNVFHCENNSFCQQTLKYYWPNAISYDDIKTTNFARHEGQIDVLTGGFPCQPFSIAGRKRGSADDRYLWPHMLRAVQQIRPTWVIAENVAGLTGMVFPPQVTHLESEATHESEEIHRTLEAAGILDRICEDLEEEGYQVVPIIIPACSVSAPHRRDRVFVLAYAYQKRGQRGKYHRQKGPIQSHKERDAEKTQPARQQQQPHFGQDCRSGVTANATFEGLERATGQRIQSNERRNAQPQTQFPFAAWVRAKIQVTNGGGGSFFEGFPSESPICGRDDGIPPRLDNITLPKLRRESLKGYGNAVVVPLVVEIFKVIEAVEKVDQ